MRLSSIRTTKAQRCHTMVMHWMQAYRTALKMAKTYESYGNRPEDTDYYFDLARRYKRQAIEALIAG